MHRYFSVCHPFVNKSICASTVVNIQNWFIRFGYTDYLKKKNTKNTFKQIFPCSRILLEKLMCPQLVKKFSACFGTGRFITASTTARHLSLPRVRRIQSIPHATSWTYILILSSHLRLCFPSGLFPSGFLIKILYAPILCHIHHTQSACLFLLNLMTLIIFKVKNFTANGKYEYFYKHTCVRYNMCMPSAVCNNQSNHTTQQIEICIVLLPKNRPEIQRSLWPIQL